MGIRYLNRSQYLEEARAGSIREQHAALETEGWGRVGLSAGTIAETRYAKGTPERTNRP